MKVKPGYKLTEVGAIPEEWLAKSLGELGKWMGGMTPSMQNPDYWLNGTIPWISSGDVKFVHLKETGYYITSEAVKHGATTMLAAGSIVVVTRSGILRKYLPVATNLIPMAINQDIKALLPKNGLSSSFLLHAITESGPRILSQCMKAGTTVESIEFKWLKAFTLAIPPLPEQRAIATVLSDLDALLDSLDRLIAKKRYLKQAAMQQLLTGQTRLPGFSGEWVVKRLDEVGTCFAGGTPSTTRTDYWGRGVFWLPSGRVQNNILEAPSDSESSITQLGLNESAAKLIKPQSVLLAITGATCANASLLQFAAAANQSVVAIEPSEGYDPRFLYYSLLLERSQILSLQSGSAQGGVNLKIVKGLEIRFPEQPEQTAIANIISDMDAELALAKDRRGKTAVLKQGMMQELLTGRTRLV